MATSIHLLVTFAVICLQFPNVRGQDRCMTLRSNVTVQRVKTYDYNGRRLRLVCTGDVTLVKCEGSCTSTVSPSIVHFPGFKKNCKCCRETTFIDRTVTLHKCYLGNRVVPGQTVNIVVKEPAKCACFACGM